MIITLVTSMRNEGPHLLEWVAHHRAAGVSNILVYSNDCEDGSDGLLDLLDTAGIVHHIRQADGKKPPQWRALKAAWSHPALHDSDWIACIDCDEFINLGSGLGGVPDLVSRVDADAIILPWRLFGNNGQHSLSNAPTTERFTRAAPADMLFPPIGSYFKTLFRRAGPFEKLGVHRPRQDKDQSLARWVDGSGNDAGASIQKNNGRIMHWGAPIARDLVQLNHYSVRSAADFMVKRARGLPNHRDKPIDLAYWVERNFNTVEDRSIAHMAPKTQSLMAKLLDIPGIAEAQQSCRNWHATKFQELMADDGELALFGRLILAAESQPPDRNTAHALIKMYQAIHAR